MSFPSPANIESGAMSGAATVTGSVAPDAGDVLLVFFSVYHSTTSFTDTTTVSGCNLTWAKVAAVGRNTETERLEAWVGYGASPSTGSITITPSQAPTGGRYVVVRLDEQGTTNPCVGAGTNSGSGTSGTVALTLTDGVLVLAAFAHRTNEATTPKTSWTEVYDSLTGSTESLEVQYAYWGDPGGSASWTSNVGWLSVGFEVSPSGGVYTCGLLPDSVTALLDWLTVHEKGMSIEVQPDTDEEGPSVAGKPSGMWAIIGGPGA